MSEGSAIVATAAGASASDAWRELRADEDIQFAEVEIPEMPPRDPTWLEEVLRWLAELFKPVGRLLAESWPVLQWVLLALAIAALIYLIVNLVDPEFFRRRRKAAVTEDDPGWRPDETQTQALLEDADRLAAQGRFDEATHLLLQRSVGQIAQVRPDLVEPSSTARELAALQWLPDTARSAFGIISERVERSLFALRSLDKADWETARAAYADFALARLEGAH